MRIKIIAVNALIVVIVSLLSFLSVRSALGTATSNKDQLAAEAENNATGAASRFQLDGLRAERWLAAAAAEPATVDALAKATQEARGDAATKRCDDIISRTKNAALFDRNVPTLVALIDQGGRIVGRNNSSLGRGDDFAGSHAGLKATLASGSSGSDIWYEQDHYLASYVAVRDDQGKIIGALVLGRPLNDTLSRVSEATTGRPLALVVPTGDSFEAAGHSALQVATLDASLAGSAKEMLRNSLSHQQTDVVKDGDWLIAAAPLAAFEDGHRGLLVVAAPSSLLEDATGLTIVPIGGALAIGLILVIVGGVLLGNYVTRPINMLEEGLLAILNGQTDKRFELDHAELGGLAFRIDQLLNQLMGVEEDTSDAEGRVSHHSVNPASFNEELEVEETKNDSAGTGMDAVEIARLAAEPSADYYARLYREYIAAKKAIGEPTDHISEGAFAGRIRSMEEDAARKYGRPVRYQVHARNKEVVLLAVSLP
jgi:hypothetical protein